MHLIKAAVIGTFLLSSPALAATLNPGGVVFTTGATFADPVHGGAQPVRNDNLIPFSLDPSPGTPLTSVNGNVQNRVTELPSGFLNFAPRLRDTSNIDGGSFVISGFRLTGYEGFSTDVEYRTDGLGDVGFDTVSRSVDGDTLNFRFDDPLRIDALFSGVQQQSLFPSIVTDATAFDLSGTMTIIGYKLNFDATGTPIDPTASEIISVTINGIAAPTVVPLPASAFLLLAGLAGLVSLRRRV